MTANIPTRFVYGWHARCNHPCLFSRDAPQYYCDEHVSKSSDAVLFILAFALSSIFEKRKRQRNEQNITCHTDVHTLQTHL